MSFRSVSSTFRGRWPGLTLALLVVGCGGARSDRSTIENIRAQAQAHVAEARARTEKRLAEAERQIEALKLDLEQTRKDLDHALRREVGPGTPEKEHASAATGAEHSTTNSFRARATEAERQSMERVNAIGQEIEVVEQRARGLAAPNRARFDGAMQRVRQQLEAVSKDLGEFDHATEQTLEPIRMRFERDFAKLREQLEAAKRRLR